MNEKKLGTSRVLGNYNKSEAAAWNDSTRLSCIYSIHIWAKSVESAWTLSRDVRLNSQGWAELQAYGWAAISYPNLHYRTLSPTKTKSLRNLIVFPKINNPVRPSLFPKIHSAWDRTLGSLPNIPLLGFSTLKTLQTFQVAEPTLSELLTLRNNGLGDFFV